MNAIVGIMSAAGMSVSTRTLLNRWPAVWAEGGFQRVR